MAEKMYVKPKAKKLKGFPKTWNILGVVFVEATHAYLRISPFEALHGRNCNTQISCDNIVDRVVIGPQLLKVKIKISHNLKISQGRQKSYENRGII